VLEVLAGFPQGLTLADIANAMALPMPSAHRLLKALATSGLVEGGSRGLRFRLGARFKQLIHMGADTDWIVTITRPYLRQLTIDIAECCYIARLSGSHVRMVVSEAPDIRWRSYVQPGFEAPPHAAASAKAILAFQNDALVSKALSQELPSLTRHTRSDKKWIRKEYAKVRMQGYATCIGEVEEGLAAVAVPIQIDGIGVLYSLAITGFVERIIERDLESKIEKLKTTAETIAKAIRVGHPRNPT
jgi:DNA-binding IclR family transcriptional regulator